MSHQWFGAKRTLADEMRRNLQLQTQRTGKARMEGDIYLPSGRDVEEARRGVVESVKGLQWPLKAKRERMR